MTKQKKLLSVPLIVVVGILIYCWTIILTTEILATWRQYLGLALFSAIAFFYFKNLIITTALSTGIFLLLATFNLLAITPNITTSGIRIGPVSTPPVQLLSLALFILYFWLNLDSLIDIQLDYKEAKTKKLKNDMN